MSNVLTYTFNNSNFTAALSGRTTDTVVVIPSTVDNDGNTYTVTSINDTLYNNFTGLTSITLPTSLISIGNLTFVGCTGLRSITFPTTLISIGYSAFNGCTGLSSITIPVNVNTIGTLAFGRCLSLTSINVDGGNANFSSISGVLFNKNITTIIRYPAAKTAASYTIPESVTIIGQGSFGFSPSLTSMTIPTSVTNINTSAFNGCASLANVYFNHTINLPTISTAVFTLNASGNTAHYVAGVLSPTNADPAAYLQSSDFANTAQFTPICFKENTKILCLLDDNESEIEIQNIKIGDLVKTHIHGYKKVTIIGQGKIYNSGDDSRVKDRLYKYTKENYPELTEELVITGGHSILVNELSEEQKERTKEYWKIFHKTDDKYRLLSVVDEKSIPYDQTGTFNIYHIVLEHHDETANYGIYANGLLVESCVEKSIKKIKYMTLTE